MSRHTNIPSDFGALLDRFADAVAERVLERLRGIPGVGTPRYATAKANPLGSRRAFIAAARRKDFQTFKHGRSVAALWEDVETFATRSTETKEQRSLEEQLAVASKSHRRRAA